MVTASVSGCASQRLLLLLWLWNGRATGVLGRGFRCVALGDRAIGFLADRSHGPFPRHDGILRWRGSSRRLTALGRTPTATAATERRVGVRRRVMVVVVATTVRPLEAATAAPCLAAPFQGFAPPSIATATVASVVIVLFVHASIVFPSPFQDGRSRRMRGFVRGRRGRSIGGTTTLTLGWGCCAGRSRFCHSNRKSCYFLRWWYRTVLYTRSIIRASTFADNPLSMKLGKQAPPTAAT